MINQAVQLSPKELENLFPFYLLIRQDGVLESFGKSMAKILPDLIPEDFFFNNWLILRPKPEEKNPYQNLDQITRKLIVLSHTSKPDLSFKGQFERLDQNDCYLFIGSPWFNNTDELLEHGLSINDFALFDSTTDLLHVLQNNEIANNELKEVVSKINQQKLTLTQSNKQLKLFQSLINNSSDAIQVSEEDGRLYYINNEASKRLGIPQQLANEYVVSDFEQIFKDRTLWLEHVETLKDTEFVTIEGRNVNQTTQEEFPVEVTVKYLNIEGKGYVLANSRDVTLRKKTELQLKIQEEKYRNIIANMNLGLLEVDMEDRIQYCNHSFSELSGYALEELVGQKAAEMFLSEENRKQIKIKNELRQTGLSDSFEMIVRNKRGEARWWLISGAPNYNDQGDIIGSIGIHLDITEQKRLERDLELALLASKEASEAKESF
ncbi:MAG: PAS domain S-box protein, partial [Chitinophagaceae bacterium]